MVEAQHKKEIIHQTKGFFMEDEVILEAEEDATTTQNQSIKFAINMATQL